MELGLQFDDEDLTEEKEVDGHSATQGGYVAKDCYPKASSL